MASSLNLLVVCTANVCRSPAAAIFLQDALSTSTQAVKVTSAGTLALNGNQAVQTIRKLMIERGYNQIESHRSQALMPHHLTQADLVFCMESEHISVVQRMKPLLSGKVYLLGHFEKRTEVADPIGQVEPIYDESLNQMQRFAKIWAQKMQKMGFI